jgi:hypothetical protein
MFDLTDPKVLKALGEFAEEARQRQAKASTPYSTEELDAAGIPQNLRKIANQWETLDEMKQDLGL